MLVLRLSSSSSSSFKLVCGLTRNTVIFRSITSTLRCCYLQTDQTDRTYYKPIYKLPFISKARLICKLKLYQTAAILGLTGISIATQSDLFLPVVLSTVSLIMLGIMGEFFRKLIGIIYVNPATNTIKFSHLNFWGNRKEVFYHIDEFISPCDAGENLSDAYVKITFVDKSIPSLYLSVKHGHIVDKELFSKFIGYSS